MLGLNYTITQRFEGRDTFITIGAASRKLQNGDHYGRYQSDMAG